MFIAQRKACAALFVWTKEAERLVKQLQRETGLSAKYIVSQIIIQGYDLIEVKQNGGGMD